MNDISNLPAAVAAPAGTALEDRMITAYQMEVALRLGRHFNHLWATIARDLGFEGTPEEMLVALRRHFMGMSAREVAEVVAPFDTGVLSGILAPTPVECGSAEEVALRHTTGSGRLTWTISPKGEVEFSVNRPGQEGVLKIHLTAGNSDEQMRPVATLLPTGVPDFSYGTRHLDAVLDAIGAVLTESEDWEVQDSFYPKDWAELERFARAGDFYETCEKFEQVKATLFSLTRDGLGEEVLELLAGLTSQTQRKLEEFPRLPSAEVQNEERFSQLRADLKEGGVTTRFRSHLY